MKNLSLAMSLLLTSACVTPNRQTSNPTGNLSAEGLSTELHGLTLEKSSSIWFALKIEGVSPNAKFNRIIPLLPGENMRETYKPTDILPGKDYIVGVDGQMLWNSTGALSAAMTEAYGKNSLKTLQVLRIEPDDKIQNIVAGDGNSLGDLRTSFAAVIYPSVKVVSVKAGSWAERNGLRAGDEIVSTVRLQSIIAKRSRLLLMSYASNQKSSRDISSSDAEEVMNLFDTMFRKIKPYHPDRGDLGGVLGRADLLKISLIRNSVLMNKNLSHSRHIGLGVMFDCAQYCANAKPVIKAMRKNSSGEQSGLKLEDLVLSVNGKRVYTSWDVIKKIRKLNYGDAVTFRLMRDDKPMDVTAKIDWVIED